jgi:Xaa-Pro aminopeptidase
MTESNRARLVDLLASRAIDGALISSSHNRRYLSGFTAEDHAPDESSGVLLIGADTAELFTSRVNAPWAQAEANAFAVKHWSRPWETSVAERVKELGWRRTGFEDRVLPVATHKRLAGAIPQLEWVMLENAVDQLRAVKSNEELERIQTTIGLTDGIFSAIAASIEPGWTETQVARLIERVTRDETEGSMAFPPIVASGPHAARPHHAVTDRRIQAGEPVIIDMGVAFRGYNGDLTRTIWLGEPSPRLAEIYSAVQAAQDAALAAIGPGAAAKSVDQAARDVLERQGFGEHILHAVGHGLGLRVHEAPSVSVKSEETLAARNVITVEPGVYIEGWGGVRIEDVVVVTKSGYWMLTGAEKQLP